MHRTEEASRSTNRRSVFFASLRAFMSSMIRTSAPTSRAREMTALFPFPRLQGRDVFDLLRLQDFQPLQRMGGPPPNRLRSRRVGQLLLDDHASGDNPLEDAGQDMIAADEHQIK
jgi:hypothetical protein